MRSVNICAAPIRKEAMQPNYQVFPLLFRFHLQSSRLDLTGDALEKEIERANAICGVSTQIIANGQLALNAEKLKQNAISADFKVPSYL